MAENVAIDETRTAIAICGLGKRYGLAPRKGRTDSLVKKVRRLTENDGEEENGRVIWALRDFSMQVERGQVIGVIGRNGAGKTTLLRILGRITAPTTGKIVGRGRIFPMLEVGASFHPDFTARENIFFNAAMFGVPREEVCRKIGEIVDFAGVGDRLDDRIGDMSSGCYIRLAFSLAVTMRPDILLADEVLAVGDASFQEACLERIRAEKKRGMSVLFVSHDMAAVADICDHVVWIDNGRIRRTGAPEEIITSYEHDLWRSKTRQVGDAANSERPVSLLATRTLGAAGHEIAAVSQAEAMKIELIFDSHCASAAVTPGVDVFSGSTLLISSWASHPTTIDAPGVYAAAMDIPAWTFTAREVRFRAALRVQPAQGASYIAESKEMLAFKVLEGDCPDPDGKQHKRARAGFIAPRLEWRMRAGSSVQFSERRAVGF